MNFVRYLLNRQPIAFAVCLVALLAAAVFGGRFITEALYFSNPAHRYQSLEPWMSPRYVSHSYDLPREVVADVFGIDLEAERAEDRRDKPPRMREIAQRQGLSIAELEAKLRATAAAYAANPDAFRHLKDDDHKGDDD